MAKIIDISGESNTTGGGERSKIRDRLGSVPSDNRRRAYREHQREKQNDH